jgi:type VI secretion system protein VasD
MNRRHFLRLPATLPFVALVAPGLLSACASPPPPPAVLNLAIDAGADQNPDNAGRAAPVAVHMYQLAATAKFERADVFAMIEREQQTLGSDVLASEEFVLSPGEQRTISRELKMGVQFIGIVVLFRDIDHATWRAIGKVATSGPSKLTLRTKGIVASLASS